MKRKIACAAMVLGMAAFGSTAMAQKQQEPPAGRSGLDPASRTKVNNVMSRSYIYGDKTRRSQVEREVFNNNTAGNGSGCSTNIGAPAATEGTAGIGNRYGTSHNDQVVVVRGSVINLCK